MKYRVPFVDYPTHYRKIKSEIDAAIADVLNGGDFIMRDQLRQFEENIASYVGTRYAIGVNSGTDAILLSLKAADIGPGDEVITVAHTFVATVAVIVQCGAKPILVDIKEDFNMDVEQAAKAVTPRTKAIIPVDLNGRLCDMEKIMAIAQKHNLVVIEDSAQALGTRFDGRMAGSFGLTGCFSFYPAKILGCFGDGGILTTNSEEVADKVYLLRDHGQRRATGDILYYGYNSRLDNLQAAVLDVKLRHLNQWIERRRELASLYQKGLADVTNIKLPPPPQTGRYFDVYTNYVIRAQNRDKLVEHFKEDGIETIVSWAKPMHHHLALGLNHFRLPETEKISKEVVSLPLNTEIGNDQVEYVVKSIHKFYGG